MCRVVSGVVAKLPGLFANSIGSKKNEMARPQSDIS